LRRLEVSLGIKIVGFDVVNSHFNLTFGRNWSVGEEVRRPLSAYPVKEELSLAIERSFGVRALAVEPEVQALVRNSSYGPGTNDTLRGSIHRSIV